MGSSETFSQNMFLLGCAPCILFLGCFATYISKTFLTRSTRQQKVSVLTIAEPPRIAPACHPPAWEAEAESLRSPIRSPSPSLTSSSARLCSGDPKPVTRSSHPPHPGWPVYPAPQERNAASPCPIPAACLLNMSLSPLSASIPRAHPGRFRRLMLDFKGGTIRQERLDFPPFGFPTLYPYVYGCGGRTGV